MKSIPELAGYEALGAFDVEGDLAVGERSRALHRELARAGSWYGYAQLDVDERDRLLAVHADAHGEIAALLAKAEAVGTHELEACVVLSDAAAHGDAAFAMHLRDAVTEIVMRRAASLELTAPGTADVRVTRRDGRAVLVVVDVR